MQENELVSRLKTMFSREEAGSADRQARQKCPTTPRLRAKLLTEDEQTHVDACAYCQGMLRNKIPWRSRINWNWTWSPGRFILGLSCVIVAWIVVDFTKIHLLFGRPPTRVSGVGTPEAARLSGNDQPVDLESNLMRTVGPHFYPLLHDLLAKLYNGVSDQATLDKLTANTLAVASIVGQRNILRLEQLRLELAEFMSLNTLIALSEDELHLAKIMAPDDLCRLAEIWLKMARLFHSRSSPERIVQESHLQVVMAPLVGGSNTVRLATRKLRELEEAAGSD